MLRKLNISQGILLAIMSIVTIFLLVFNIILIATFRTTSLDNVKYSSREINKQVIMNFENYIDNVIETSNYITAKTLSLTVDDNISALEETYLQASALSKDIVSIVLLSENGLNVVNSNGEAITSDAASKSWFTKALDTPEIFNFSTPHNQDIFSVSNRQVITISKAISYYDALQVLKTGVLCIDLNTESLISLANKTNLGENGHILIISDTGDYVYSNNEECTLGVCASRTLADDLIFGGQTVVVDTEKMYLNVNTLTHTRWRIATFINIQEIYNSQTRMMFTSIGFFLVALLSSYIVAVGLSKRISNPLHQLSEHMNKLDQDFILEEIQLTGQLEVVTLSESFNEMILEIRSLMDKLVTEQKEKRKSEFFALQMQINPHFLYNTLDSIVWLAEKEKNQDVIEMVIALSKFFRISISKGKNIIPVTQELEHAKNYLNIQKIRYNRQFDFEFITDDDIYHYSVVKLILQPIIENAINHGISSEEGGGFIKIIGTLENGFISFEVINSGYGLTNEQINTMYERMREGGKAQSVGLRNVYQRMKIYYGEEADIVISSQMDEYTSIKLIIPARKDA
ncbi:MAG: sensor histidine kinase [Tenericutes bacterium]|nr:sensor histidine kinase [Mycoplasmatota bacterium]